MSGFGQAETKLDMLRLACLERLREKRLGIFHVIKIEGNCWRPVGAYILSLCGIHERASTPIKLICTMVMNRK